ncbi:hypothetical protein NDU88_004167 [Pleurodeles waltl]|uniref:Uncharacterized protein n=1 Tax=Pleurodeles waltl TaxID=8319 RepID=A0AAV7RKQ2_PLEWA|nr:hypothetical protein NDU88_004167 [Pleurodeles waltl]
MYDTRKRDFSVGAAVAEPAERRRCRARTRGSYPRRVTRAGPEGYSWRPAASRSRAVKHRVLLNRKAEPAGIVLTVQRGAPAKQLGTNDAEVASRVGPKELPQKPNSR